MNSLSIVVPAYNEQQRLPATLDRILAWRAAQTFSFFELLVVDDGSRDGTAALVERYAQRACEIRLLRNPGNRGKGYAVRHGMLTAQGEWILYSDADLSSPIGGVEKLYAAACAQSAQVAIGSRALDRSLVSVHQPWMREYSGRFFNFAMRLATGLPFQDTQCGFKLFERAAAIRIFSLQQLDGFSFDVEDLIIAMQCGFRVIEVPVRWADVKGTKVNLAQGLRSFADLLRIRWRHRRAAKPGSAVSV